MDPALIQANLIKQLQRAMDAMRVLYENRDERNFGLMAGYPPPKDLILAKAALETAVNQSVTEDFRETVGHLVESLNRIEDLFQKAPKLIQLISGSSETDEESEEEVVVI